ncbi:MAG: phospho-sugar mutase, partial [Bacteroidales bacterium]|nr:phospho-sugar mutase [Bacteroidales bacterium]
MENNELLKEVRAKAQEWLSPTYDEQTRKEVQALLDNENPTGLIDSFYRSLEFGTGGLRGIMGVGTNRVNIYT